MDSSCACSYRHFDSDGNGELDENEIQQALQHAGLLPINLQYQLTNCKMSISG